MIDQGKVKQPNVTMMQIGPFKLKDGPKRRSVIVNLVKGFGYPVPVIQIVKMPGANNTFAVLAPVPRDRGTHAEPKKGEPR